MNEMIQVVEETSMQLHGCCSISAIISGLRWLVIQRKYFWMSKLTQKCPSLVQRSGFGSTQCKVSTRGHHAGHQDLSTASPFFLVSYSLHLRVIE